MSILQAIRWILLLGCTGIPIPHVALAQSPEAGERGQCLAYCDRADAECSGAARRAKADCARHAATGGVDPMSMRRLSPWACSYRRGEVHSRM